MRPALVLLSLSLLSASLPAGAAEYLITGPEVAGHAVVTVAGGKPTAKATLKVFGKSPATLTYEGPLALKADGHGGYAGTLKGRAQTWTPIPVPASSIAALAVPGLSTNLWNKIGIRYLDENLAALQALGFQARRLAIKTEDSVATNAAFIAAEIRKEAQAGRRVILVAHSKGGSDTTAALALNPDLTKAVAGVVLIQPVYGGSPVAQLVEKHRLLEKAVQAIFEGVFKGQKEAVLDISFDARKVFVGQHPYPAAQIPTVVVRSSFQRKLSKSVLWANQKIISYELKQPNDGMVIVRDQAVPGAIKTIDLDDMDHFEPGLRNESKHTPLEVTVRGVLALAPAIR